MDERPAADTESAVPSHAVTNQEPGPQHHVTTRIGAPSLAKVHGRVEGITAFSDHGRAPTREDICRSTCQSTPANIDTVNVSAASADHRAASGSRPTI